METHRFTLYVVEGSRASRSAAVNLERMLGEAGIGEYELDVVDVSHDPEAAEREGVLATPTLVRHSPRPRRRIVGDLSDVATVRAALALPVAFPEVRGASD